MSKKKKQKNQQIHESYADRARRIIKASGFAEEKEQSEEPKGATTEGEKSVADAVSNSADEKALALMEALEQEKEKLSNREQELKKKEQDLEKLIQERTEESIKKLDIDVPAAKEEVRAMREEAQREKESIIAEGKRQANDLEAKAADVLKEAKAALNRAGEKEKALAELSEALSKKEIRLQNEEIAYRNEIGNEISEEYKDQIAQIDSFAKEKGKLEKKAEYFKANYETANQKLGKLSAVLSDYDQKKRELEAKEGDCKHLEEECKQLRRNIGELKSQLSRIGSDPLIYKSQLEALEKDHQAALDRLANVPSDLELTELRRKADEFEKLSKKYSEQKQKLFESTSELTSLKTKASQLDDYIQYVRILDESKRQLRAELSSLQDEYESENNDKFKALSHFDKSLPARSDFPIFNDSLSELTKRFLGFAQNEKPALYYEESTIAAFFSWMASTKTLILEGLSGTGKTSLPLAFSRFAGWYTPRISVQSAWKDRNDLVGFFNDFKKEYKETEFLKSLYRAAQNPDRPALIVLDEMNLSRIEYYFADFLSALEDPDTSNRVIDLLPDQSSDRGMPELFVDGGKLLIKSNIWFVGTANKDDSTFAITDKVYDRAGVIYFSSRGEKKADRPNQPHTFVSYKCLHSLFDEASYHFDSDAKKTYEEVRKCLIESMLGFFDINIGNRILSQMDVFVPVYLRCRNSNEKRTVYEAVDEFFPHKVLRKLEGLYDANTKRSIGDMIKELQNYDLPKIKTYLNALQAKID